MRFQGHFYGEGDPLVAPAEGLGEFEHAVEDFAVVDLDDVLPARNAERFERIGGEHAELGVDGNSQCLWRSGTRSSASMPP